MGRTPAIIGSPAGVGVDERPAPGHRDVQDSASAAFSRRRFARLPGPAATATARSAGGREGERIGIVLRGRPMIRLRAMAMSPKAY